MKLAVDRRLTPAKRQTMELIKTWKAAGFQAIELVGQQYLSIHPNYFYVFLLQKSSTEAGRNFLPLNNPYAISQIVEILESGRIMAAASDDRPNNLKLTRLSKK